MGRVSIIGSGAASSNT